MESFDFKLVIFKKVKENDTNTYLLEFGKSYQNNFKNSLNVAVKDKIYLSKILAKFESNPNWLLNKPKNIEILEKETNEKAYLSNDQLGSWYINKKNSFSIYQPCPIDNEDIFSIMFFFKLETKIYENIEIKNLISLIKKYSK